MAKYGEKKVITFKDKKGKETKFNLQHVGLQGSFEILDRTKDANGNTSITAMHSELFEHVIRTEDNEQVSYDWFEDQDFGSEMLKEVVKESTKFIFQ